MSVRGGRGGRAGRAASVRGVVAFGLLSVSGSVMAASGQAAELRGFITDGVAGGLLFQRCEGRSAAATQAMLRDQSPAGALTEGVAEVRRVMHDPEQPLYVEFSGDGTGEIVTARRFRRAIGHVLSCADLPALAPTVRLLAEGVRPAWRLQASASGTRFERVGHKPVLFRPVSSAAPASHDMGRAYEVPAAGARPALRLELLEKLCHDSASETAYGATAQAQVGSDRLQGCAARF